MTYSQIDGLTFISCVEESERIIDDLVRRNGSVTFSEVETILQDENLVIDGNGELYEIRHPELKNIIWTTPNLLIFVLHLFIIKNGHFTRTV